MKARGAQTRTRVRTAAACAAKPTSGSAAVTVHSTQRSESRLLSYNNDFRENTPHVARQGVLYEVLSTHY